MESIHSIKVFDQQKNRMWLKGTLPIKKRFLEFIYSGKLWLKYENKPVKT